MRRTILLLVFAYVPAAAAAAEPEINEMLKAAAAYRPGDRDLTWREIPWYGDAESALKQAREEKRPLFVWLAGGRDRDGSPLERC
jgi:hypothetical protein